MNENQNSTTNGLQKEVTKPEEDNLIPNVKQVDLGEHNSNQKSEELVNANIEDMKKFNTNNSNKEPISAEREARRLAKQLEKHKIQDKNRNLPEEATTSSDSVRLNVQKSFQKPSEDHQSSGEIRVDKTREQILVERELKKQAKLLAKKKGKPESGPTTDTVCEKDNQTDSKAQQMSTMTQKLEDLSIASKATTKAERRAKQEAQRAAKAKMLEEKAAAVSASKTTEKSESQDKLKVVNAKVFYGTKILIFVVECFKEGPY